MRNLIDVAAAPKVVYYARRSRELGKLAAASEGNASSNALAEKTAADAALYGLIDKVANRLMDTYATLKAPLLRGLGYGAGAAVPLALAGQYIAGEVGDEASSSLMGPAGIVGGGAALLALSNLLNRDDGHGRESHGRKKESTDDLIKTGAAAFCVVGKLAYVANSTEDPELRKLAQETLSIALAHVADIVGDIVL